MKPASASGPTRKLKLVGAALALVVVAAACEAKPGDFTGDSQADQVYMVNSTGAWFTAGSSTPLFTGQANDIPVAGDYNGDLKWEPAVLRGTTWISSALTDPIVYDPAGMPAGPAPTAIGENLTPPTLLPVPGDYDNTGKTQPAYYDQVDGSWWIMGRDGSTQFGIPPSATGGIGYDVPVPADYDGDGKTDIAVFRPTDNTFHYLSSKTGGEVVLSVTVPPGQSETLPVPGDYDGVGHAEAAVTDEEMLHWYVGASGTSIASFPYDGKDEYIPAPADYNGDGKVEPAAIDNDNGDFWMAGQPRPPETDSGTRIIDDAGVSPTASLGGHNYIRLVLYEQCQLEAGMQNGCPPGALDG